MRTPRSSEKIFNIRSEKRKLCIYEIFENEMVLQNHKQNAKIFI